MPSASRTTERFLSFTVACVILAHQHLQGARRSSAPLKFGRWWAVILVFAVAFAVREYRIDLTAFQDDQAEHLAPALQMLATHQVPATTGKRFSVGINEPPLTTFILAVPLSINRNPAWVAAFTALLDSVAAVLVFLTGRLLSGWRAGLAAGLLYALAPAAIAFSRTVTNPDMGPCFVALALYSFVSALRSKGGRWLAVALLALGVAVELHPSAAGLLLLWPAVAGWLWWRRRAVNFGWSALAVALLALTLAPYLNFQTQHHWADARAAVQFLTSHKVLDLAVVQTTLSMVGGGRYSQLLTAADAPYHPTVPTAGWLLIALVIAGVAVASCRAEGWVAIAALGLPVLASLRHTVGIESYYMLPAMPGAFVLAGLGATGLPRALALPGLVGAFTICLAQYAAFQGALNAPNHGSVLGVPLRYAAMAAHDAEALDRDGQPIRVASQGYTTDTFRYLLGGTRPATQVDGRYSFVFPRRSTLYIAEADGGFADQFLLRHDGPPLAQVRTPSGAVAYYIFSVPADAGSQYRLSGGHVIPLDVRVGHVLRLRGLAIGRLQADRPSPVTLEWQVTGTSSSLPAEIDQFGHLVSADGTTWSRAPDVHGYRAALWQPGDLVLTRFNLDPLPTLPQGGYWIETGFVPAYSNQRLPMSRAGHPAGTEVRVGPLKVLGVPPVQATAGALPLAVFGQQEIALLKASCAGAQLQLVWHALSKPGASYTSFIHVLDAGGRLLEQHDSLPHNGSYPTNLWAAGETVVDTLTLHQVAGAARLEIGLYTYPDLQRLAAFTAAGKPMGSRWIGSAPRCV